MASFDDFFGENKRTKLVYKSFGIKTCRNIVYDTKSMQKSTEYKELRGK
jgi:hypothetical protein